MLNWTLYAYRMDDDFKFSRHLFDFAENEIVSQIYKY